MLPGTHVIKCCSVLQLYLCVRHTVRLLGVSFLGLLHHHVVDGVHDTLTAAAQTRQHIQQQHSSVTSSIDATKTMCITAPASDNTWVFAGLFTASMASISAAFLLKSQIATISMSSKFESKSSLPVSIPVILIKEATSSSDMRARMTHSSRVCARTCKDVMAIT